MVWCLVGPNCTNLTPHQPTPLPLLVPVPVPMVLVLVLVALIPSKRRYVSKHSVSLPIPITLPNFLSESLGLGLGSYIFKWVSLYVKPLAFAEYNLLVPMYFRRRLRWNG